MHNKDRRTDGQTTIHEENTVSQLHLINPQLGHPCQSHLATRRLTVLLKQNQHIHFGATQMDLQC